MLIRWHESARRLLCRASVCVSSCALICGAASLAGCASPLLMGPDYRAPEAAQLLPDADWQAALPHEGREQKLLDWWRTFNDPVLDEFLARAGADSPTLALASARIDEARSQLDASTSRYWPELGLNAHYLRNNGSADVPAPAMTTRGTTLDARWEIDLFGQTRRGTALAASAWLTQSELGWHAARISLAAEVADRYVSYRACEAVLLTLDAELASRQQSSRGIALAARAGWLAATDEQLARAAEAGAASQQEAGRATCARLRKSLVTLTGWPEATVAGKLAAGKPATLPVPAGFSVDYLPVALLSQRPDLASAERELAASHAQAGAARADRFPRLSLVGSLTRDKSYAGDGPTVISSPWFFGPALTLPLFNGGALAAREEAANARHAQALARYRQAVRLAVEEAEGALLGLDAARATELQAKTAAAALSVNALAAEKQWQAGGVSRLALEESRRAAQVAERQAIISQRDLVRCWITLYKALGGGWNEIPPGPGTPLSAGASS